MSRSPNVTGLITVAASLLAFQACDDAPVSPEGTLSLSAFGRDGGVVTGPMEIHWGEGTFVVVPFDDPMVPAGTPVANCPDGGQANPALGLPAGFPNGSGFVVSQGDGQGRHFGRLAEFSTRCAVQFFPPTDPAFVNFDLRTTYTAADGSQIFGKAPYAKTPFTPPEVETKNLRIVGGTGRFEGASGFLEPPQGLTVTCTDDSGLCLQGTWSGGFSEGELTLPKPGGGG